MTRGSTIRLALAACFLPALAVTPALAQDGEEEAFDRTPQDCVSTNGIDQTDAVDDQNILFYMRNGSVYRNHLPRKCPGLERENRFAYKLVGSQRLCSINTITVLEDGFGVGGGFREGFTCRLGEFVPLSPEEIEDLELLDDEDGRRTQSTIESTPVEPPADESSDDAED
jgi:hypothetical protein